MTDRPSNDTNDSQRKAACCRPSLTPRLRLALRYPWAAALIPVGLVMVAAGAAQHGLRAGLRAWRGRAAEDPQQ